MPNYQELQKHFMVNTYPNRNLTFVKGDGIYLFDERGEKYLDLMSNYGVNIFGYNHKELTNAIADQLTKITTLHCSFANDTRAIASKKLASILNNGCKYIYWGNSGAEAVEAALKFAVLATGKKKFVACKNSYHGKTLGALSVTYSAKYREPFLPLLWNVTYIDYNDPNKLISAIDKDTAAFIVEPIQGESGVRIPDDNYLKNIEAICKQNEILLILDEIQTGCGRTGNFLASHQYNISPDIICLGKGLAGGIPIGVTVVSERIAAYIGKSIHTSTFGGNPLACAGVNAVLQLLTNGFMQKIESLGKYFIELLKTIKSHLIVEVRGKGLMIGVEVIEKRNDILQILQINKILAAPAGDNVIRFLPPYIIDEKNIEYTAETLRNILTKM